ncbi:hypothetical protein [Sphingobium boeckii]|uniref:Uncharacterized protein n=1 Tax=Sphingobium boeckii TaxID=1082345 RepID=A0A7W9EF40_9SPHN|nr:hypothetical protein [Sphingobium boeckii]MBB5686659.1 hypothetical protein [Sphingobium boeckii]
MEIALSRFGIERLALIRAGGRASDTPGFKACNLIGHQHNMNFLVA